MKKLISITIFISLNAWSAWDQPQILCPEEVLPKGIACLDLTQVIDPGSEFPVGMSLEEKARWQSTWASDLKFCRNQEYIRRESLSPGSYTPLQIQLAWMITTGAQNTNEKFTALMSASAKYQIPPQILLGAITQESLLSSLGISPDGGNYSCGIAQLNIGEWCQGMTSLPVTQREAIGWPRISCASLSSKLLKPFYELAKLRLGTRPEYRIDKSDFTGISIDQVLPSFPAADPATQEARFKAVTSFINNCQDFNLSISAKAMNLSSLFHQFVPKELKTAEIYKDTTFLRQCQHAYPTKYYPLHTGWLLAVAIYNAGPRQTQLIEHYYQNPHKLPEINPKDLIEALHWGGKFVEGSKRIQFTGRDGRSMTQLWFKSCVVQRHVARVIQHVGIPGKPLVQSIEQAPCTRDDVPEYRQLSSGVKEI